MQHEEPALRVLWFARIRLAGRERKMHLQVRATASGVVGVADWLLTKVSENCGAAKRRGFFFIK